MTFFQRFLALVLLAVSFPNAVFAQSAQAICETYSRPNIDCGCVAKRFDAYANQAETDTQRGYLLALYKNEMGLNNELPRLSEAIFSDPRSAINFDLRFEGVGGRPENISDFERGCVIAGAPLPELPTYRPGPVRDKWINACMITLDKRSCDCTLAVTDRELTEREFQFLYVTTKFPPPSESLSLSEERVYWANKLGVSLEEYNAVVQRGRNKVQDADLRNTGECNALLWADQNKGRSAVARAGTPIGFEDTGTISTMSDIEADQQAAVAAAKAQAAQIPDVGAQAANARAQAAAAMAQIEENKARGKELVKSTEPSANFDKWCAAAGNEAPTCTCLRAIYDEQVASNNASKGVATQLALLMTGGGNDNDTLAMMQSNPADMAAAGQIYGQSMMQLMSCP